MISSHPNMFAYLPYFILISSILATRLIRSNSKSLTWAALGLTLTFGVLSKVVLPLGIFSIGLLAVSAHYASRSDITPFRRNSAYFLTVLMSLAIAMHKVPGFQNYLVVENINLTPNSLGFTLYANLDKGLVGFILLNFFCETIPSIDEFKDGLKKMAVPSVMTITGVFLIAYCVKWVGFDPGLKPYFLQFLVINLFFVCFAEEAFFRGFLQEIISQKLGRAKFASAWSLVICSMLFGLTHFNGKIPVNQALIGVLLGTLAGLGYGYVYQKTRKVEYAVLLHFALNMIHFIAFTYPSMKQY